jgi:phage recombination protein Bet
MNAVATINDRPKSVLLDMASRYGMEPAAFEATLRATVCKGQVSKEEFAAFLLVAKEHRLNPVTKEIYAFPAKGGGIQPIVSVDGWARIINEHPAFDGMEFVDEREDGALVAVTCRMFRKDRSHPIAATEYMSECKRTTDVWAKWPARMLRHKAMIQCARYAFGFSGIMEQDEYERLVEVRSGQANAPRALTAGFITDAGAAVVDVTPAAAEAAPEPVVVETAQPAAKTGAELLAQLPLSARAKGLETSLRNASTQADLAEAWEHAADLRRDLDGADPDRLFELEQLMSDREEALA